MTPAQRYQFDLAGYLIIRNALDPQLLAELNAVVDGYEALSRLDLHGASPADRAPRTEVRCEPIIIEEPVFAHAILSPALISCVQHLMTWPRLKSTWLDFKSLGGAVGYHANHVPNDPLNHYHFQDGRSCCSNLTCCFALRDLPSDGGAVQVIPGSHKANLPLPRDDQAHAAMLVPLPMQAGDCLVFSHDLHHGSSNKRDYVRRTLWATFAPGCYATRQGSAELHDRLHAQAPEGSWRRYLLRRPHGAWDDQEPPAHPVEDELRRTDGTWRWTADLAESMTTR